MPTGRPSKLTPDLQAQVASLLRLGSFVATVCDRVGISKPTYYAWLNRGERGWETDIEGGYVDFSNAIKKATAQAEAEAVRDILNGVDGWQSRAWWLERRHPDKWGKGKQGARTGCQRSGEHTLC